MPRNNLFLIEYSVFISLLFIQCGGTSDLRAETYLPSTCDQVGANGGFLCSSDCTSLKRCFRTGNSWREIVIDSCDTGNGLYCNSQQGKCTEKPTVCSSATDNAGFSCSGFGIFPNPYDCQKFFICFGEGSDYRSITCDGNTAYNSITNDCSKSTSDKICVGQPHYVCNDTVSRGLWTENYNIYYYCFTDGKITMVRCEDTSQSWDKSGTSCGRSSSGSVSGSPGSGSESSGTSFTCTTSGLFPDVTDCYKYYICSGYPLVAEHRSCPNGFYFNTSVKGCKKGTCTN